MSGCGSSPVGPGPQAGSLVAMSGIERSRLRRERASAWEPGPHTWPYDGLVTRAWLGLAAVVLVAIGVAITDAPAGGRLGGDGGGSTSEAVAHQAPPATISVVVRPGDTLWSLAAGIVGDGDPRPVVDQLAAAHAGDLLHPGDVITIPAP